MLEGRMNTQLKTSEVDKNRFGVLSTVVTALGTHLRVWVALGSGPAPALPSKANPELGIRQHAEEGPGGDAQQLAEVDPGALLAEGPSCLVLQRRYEEAAGALP